ncbi:hypothetical protein [Halotia branconii]|uniref:Uncharacterized protein n=1 Tax=Halotia branconii CENA392 TaxID=1539056 RepID=A0AAJ6NQJ0_9CYAN|nr:hypothetical protein [Halotia branconii]WGV24742.1 hypothetical protein QI031_23705 [Halotia branconii CENA392]
MDITLLVKILAPCLPFLLNVGNKAVEGASQKVGEDVWNKAKVIWAKLHPQVEAKAAAKEVATDVATNPDDEDLQASLRVQLKKILDADKTLAQEIAQILQASTDKPGDNIQISANAYDQSKVNQVGKIDANEVSF